MTETVAMISALIGMAIGSVLTAIAFGLGTMAGRRAPSPLEDRMDAMLTVLESREAE